MIAFPSRHSLAARIAASTTTAEEVGFLGEVDPARQRSTKIPQLEQAWQAMRPSAETLPGRQHFDPAAVGRLLPQILMLDVLRDGAKVSAVRFRLIGSAIRDAYGEDTTGAVVDKLPLHHRMAAESGRPVWRFGPPAQPILKGRVAAIENLLLPLATDGETVDVLVMLSVFFDQGGREFRPFKSRLNAPRSV